MSRLLKSLQYRGSRSYYRTGGTKDLQTLRGMGKKRGFIAVFLANNPLFFYTLSYQNIVMVPFQLGIFCDPVVIV